MKILQPSNSSDQEFYNDKELFLNSLLQSIDLYAVFTTDKEGIITSWNRGAANLFGYTEEEILGRSANLLYTPEDIASQTLEAEMREAMEAGRGINERYHVRRDRTRFWGSGLVFPLIDSSGKHQGFTKTMRNFTWLKDSQEETQQVREIFQTTIEASPTPIYVCTGPELVLSMANPATLRAWGKDSSVIGKRISDALPELADQPFLEIKRKVFETGVPYNSKGVRVELVVDSKRQNYYFKITYQPLRDTEGKIYALLCTATDVTELVNAQKQLEESQENLNKMISQAPVAMCVLRGSEYFIEVANSKMFVLWGFGEEYLNKRLFDGLPHLEPKFKPLLDQVYFEDKVITLDENPVELLRAGKLETTYINFSYQPIKEPDGSTSAVLAVAIDVTSQVISRKQIEEIEKKTQALNEQLIAKNDELSSINEQLLQANSKLYESEERFKLAVDNAEAGIFDTNLITGRTVRSLRHALIFGYPDLDEEWSEDKFISHIYPPDVQLAHETLSIGLSSGNLNNELRIRRKDGAIRWVNIVGKIHYNEENQPVRIIGTITDITARKELQRQKDEFISTVSHELKTPITSIKAYAQYLLRTAQEEDSKRLNFLQRMDAQISSLGGLIKGLLDTTRVEVGRLNLNMQDLQLNEVLAQHISDLQVISPTHRLILTHNPPIVVKADRERITQVVTNFITNAVKYSPKADRVHISLTLTDSDVVFAVQDFGEGIPEEHHKELFQRFHQVNQLDMNMGLGLGLYISKEIILKHGGRIWLESKANKGSTFYFSLPVEG